MMTNGSKWHTDRARRMDMYHALGSGIWNACAVMGKQPTSAIDFGSSIGALLSVLPITHRRGLDYSPDALQGRMIDDIVLTDLDDMEQIRKAIDGSKYDLIICQEVAEHLRSVRAESAATFSMPLLSGINMAAHDKSVLVFGAAYPNQPGKGHINCRTARYWQLAIEYMGWVYEHRATMVYAALLTQTQDVIASNGHTNCYLNTMIYSRSTRR